MHHPMKRTITFITTFCALMLLVVPALAGTIKIYDIVKLLPNEDQVTLTHTAATWPFDSVVYIDNIDRTTLRSKAEGYVTTPQTVVIAISPSTKGTSVRFGSGTNVDSALWEAIAKSGNAPFKEGKWRVGIEAIGFRSKLAVDQARASVAPTVTVHPRPAPSLTHHEKSASLGAYIAIGLLAVFFIGLIAWMLRRHRRQTEELKEAADKLSFEAADIASKSIEQDERRESARWEEVEARSNRRIAERPARRTPDMPRPSSTARASRHSSPAPIAHAHGVTAGGGLIGPPSRHASPAPIAYVPSPAPVYSHHTTLVERGGGASDFAMGMLVADAMHDSRDHAVEHHHHHHSHGTSRRSEPPPQSSRNDYSVGGGDSSWASTVEVPSPPSSRPSAPSFFESSSSDTSFSVGGGDSDWND